jgi:hypothetical protein
MANKTSLTFDKSAARFFLSAMNYNVEGNKIYKGKNQAKCYSCKDLLTLNNFAGFLNKKIVCNHMFCLMKVIDEK